MYTIACRAHFCHLLGIGQVGHSPVEPMGVLGPCTGAQCGWAPSPLSTPIHPWHPLHPLMSPKWLLHPLGAPMPPDAPILLLAPEYWESLPAPYTSDTPTPLNIPILRIPDEPPCYVRQYGGKSHLCLAIYYNMSCVFFIIVFMQVYMFSFVSSRGFICICVVYIFFFFFVILLLYYVCSTICFILAYTIFRFLNPQNSALYNSHNYK